MWLLGPDNNSNSRLGCIATNAIAVLIGIFVFFNPFPHTTTIKETCFYLAVALALARTLTCYPLKLWFFKAPINIALFLLVGWAFAVLPVALDRASSLHDICFHLLKYVIFYFLAVHSFGTKRRLELLSWLIISSTTIASILGLVYDYVVLGRDTTTRFGLDFTEVSTNTIGIITLLAILFCLHKLLSKANIVSKAISMSCLVPLTTATFMTQTRSAVIALIVSSTILLLRRKKALLIVATTVFAISIITPTGKRFAEQGLLVNIRVRQCLLTYEVIKDYPLTGIGFGMKPFALLVDLKSYSKRLAPKYQEMDYMGIPHSILLDITVGLGIVGLALFLFLIYCAFRMCIACAFLGREEFVRQWGLLMLAALTGFFIIGFFESVFIHMAEVVLYTIFAVAAVLWQINMPRPVPASLCGEESCRPLI